MIPRSRGEFAHRFHRRRHYDGELIRSLESQIRLLESALRSRSEGIGESDETLHHTISMSQCEEPAPGVQISDYEPGYGPSALSPTGTTTSADDRSASAMEELASLMLEMDIEEKGEPSFTIAAGKRQAPETDYQMSPLEAVVSIPREQGAEPLAPEISQELLGHLVDCFVRHFNSYHQFLDTKDIEHLKVHGFDTIDIDCRFRNAALLAVAACFSDQEDAKQIGASYSVLAQGLPFHCIRHRPSDLVVQGLALLAWKELVFGNPSMAYNYICTMALHRNESYYANKCSHGHRASALPRPARIRLDEVCRSRSCP